MCGVINVGAVTPTFTYNAHSSPGINQPINMVPHLTHVDLATLKLTFRQAIIKKQDATGSYTIVVADFGKGLPYSGKVNLFLNSGLSDVITYDQAAVDF